MLVEAVMDHAYLMGELDRIVILGDFCDFFALSSHGPSAPKVGTDLIDELDEAQHILREWKKRYAGVPIVFCVGNHEYRIDRFLIQNAKQLWGMVNVTTLLNLDQIGIEVIPYGRNQSYKIPGTDLIARHEPLGAGENPQMTTIKKGRCSMIFGHTHRLGFSTVKDFQGNAYYGYNAGFLGDESSKIYDYIKGKTDWHRGFAMASYDDNGWFCDLVPIKEYRCVYDSVIYYVAN